MIDSYESYYEINAENGTLGLTKIKLKILKTDSDLPWYSDFVGQELYFWDKIFISDNAECLWAVEEREVYKISSWIPVSFTNYYRVIRKEKLIKIKESI